MATAIGFYAGEGAQFSRLSEAGSKELVVIDFKFGTPTEEVRTALTRKFVEQRFNDACDSVDIELYSKWIVIATIIDEVGSVFDYEQYAEQIS